MSVCRWCKGTGYCDEYECANCNGSGKEPKTGMSETRVVHCRREPYDIYIGRPGLWGNPFSHRADTRAQFRVGSREEAIAAYERWIMGQPDLLARLPELRGKALGCWCAPKSCHGDVLVRLTEAAS